MSIDADVIGSLVDAMRRFGCIDAHAHLMPEIVQNSRHKDALSVYGQYVRLPMLASGLPYSEWERMHDGSVPLRERWAILKPYLERIQFTSFARAARQTLEHFWGVPQLTDDNIEEVSQRIAAENRPGLYQRVLREHCNIFRVCNQDTLHNDCRDLEVYRDQDILAPVVSLLDVKGPEGAEVNHLIGPDNRGSLDGYLEWARERLAEMAHGGAIGFKTFAVEEVPVDRSLALAEFADLQRAGVEMRIDVASRLRSYLHDRLLATASQLGLPVAVHTGYWRVDQFHPVNLIPLLERFPALHFDLFHAGVPYVREIGAMAINYPNTSLNLCWAHSNNASMAASALDEYIDWLGSDKLIAFGSDVHQTVEKVYGHLELARQNIAHVLARRIDAGLLDLDGALRLTQEWFVENPVRIYRLPIMGD
jgi:predicted TIM-barrel fold metal-dependent hydrolase